MRYFFKKCLTGSILSLPNDRAIYRGSSWPQRLRAQRYDCTFRFARERGEYQVTNDKWRVTMFEMKTSNTNPAEVASLDAIITAAYDGISGAAGEKRDWDRERSLFYPGAHLIPTARPGANDGLAPQILDVDGFIARVEPYFAEQGFFEKEIARHTEQFGNIAHVWSTYESRHNADDPEPFMRGINSIQLFYDGNRWWIVNIYWQQESAEDPIPEKYL